MLGRCAVVGLCVVLLLGGLTMGELYRNEGLRARLAWEAFTSGSWVVPTLYGEPHLTKPPGMSVLIVLCSLPFGEVTPFTARLPSVLAGAMAVVLLGWSVSRWVGSRAGWLAAALLPCCPLWLDRVPSAEIDLVQLAWVTASLLLLFDALERDRWGSWIGAFLCMSGGFFTKWTAPAFFYLTLIPLLFWRGELRRLVSLPHLIGVLLFVALAGMWLLHVVREVGASVLLETISREALLRLSPAHHPRPYPWDELLTFPLGFLAACLPVTLLAACALRPSFVHALAPSSRRLWQFAIVWLVSSLIFWTLAPGHRPRHILPAQPAVVLLAALAGEAWLAGSFRWRLSPRPILASLLISWLVVKLVWIGVVVPARGKNRDLEASAATLRQLVPSSDTLHLMRLKDDGLLFYYGRPARRLSTLDAAPATWVLLTDAERQAAALHIRSEISLTDGQGDPVYLVCLNPSPDSPGTESCRIDSTDSKE